MMKIFGILKFKCTELKISNPYNSKFFKTTTNYQSINQQIPNKLIKIFKIITKLIDHLITH